MMPTLKINRNYNLYDITGVQIVSDRFVNSIYVYSQKIYKPEFQTVVLVSITIGAKVSVLARSRVREAKGRAGGNSIKHQKTLLLRVVNAVLLSCKSLVMFCST